jgi:hypothetical protein
MNWPFRKQAPVPKVETQIKVIHRKATELRLHEWRQDSRLVGAARALLTGDHMKIMLDVLRNEHPGNTVFTSTVDLQTRAAHQAKCEGYTICLANLEAMADFKEPEQTVEPTFQPEQNPN